MFKFAMFSSVAVVLLSRLAITLTFLHFVYSVSSTHAVTMAMLYLIMLIGERNIMSLAKSQEGKDDVK